MKFDIRNYILVYAIAENYEFFDVISDFDFKTNIKIQLSDDGKWILLLDDKPHVIDYKTDTFESLWTMIMKHIQDNHNKLVYINNTYDEPKDSFKENMRIFKNIYDGILDESINKYELMEADGRIAEARNVVVDDWWCYGRSCFEDELETLAVAVSTYKGKDWFFAPNLNMIHEEVVMNKIRNEIKLNKMSEEEVFNLIIKDNTYFDQFNTYEEKIGEFYNEFDEGTWFASVSRLDYINELMKQTYPLANELYQKMIKNIGYNFFDYIHNSIYETEANKDIAWNNVKKAVNFFYTEKEQLFFDSFVDDLKIKRDIIKDVSAKAELFDFAFEYALERKSDGEIDFDLRKAEDEFNKIIINDYLKFDGDKALLSKEMFYSDYMDIEEDLDFIQLLIDSNRSKYYGVGVKFDKETNKIIIPSYDGRGKRYPISYIFSFDREDDIV